MTGGLIDVQLTAVLGVLGGNAQMICRFDVAIDPRRMLCAGPCLLSWVRLRAPGHYRIYDNTAESGVFVLDADMPADVTEMFVRLDLRCEHGAFVSWTERAP